MVTNDLILLTLGAGCALWTIGLAFWIAYAEQHHRDAVLRGMGEALRAIIERTGEMRRSKPKQEAKAIFPAAE